MFKWYVQKLSEVDTGNNKVKANFIKDDITDFKKDIENMSKDDVDKIEEMNKGNGYCWTYSLL